MSTDETKNRTEALLRASDIPLHKYHSPVFSITSYFRKTDQLSDGLRNQPYRAGNTDSKPVTTHMEVN